MLHITPTRSGLMHDFDLKLAEDRGTILLETHTRVREHPKVLSCLCQSGLGHPYPAISSANMNTQSE